MIALMIIFGVLLFLFLLTLIPIRIAIGFEEKFSLTLRYLFLKFDILPAKEESTAEETDATEKKENTDVIAKIKRMLKRNGVAGFLKSLCELVKLIAESSVVILKHVKLRSFDLYICLGSSDDVGAAAMRYGEISGAVYSACGVLFGLMPCRIKGVSVDLDYEQEEDSMKFSAAVSVMPVFLIKEGLALLVKSLPIFNKLLKTNTKSSKRKVNENERQQG